MKTLHNALGVVAGVLLAWGAGPLCAGSREAELIDAATVVLDDVMTAGTGRPAPPMLDVVQGIAIIPNLRKGGLVVGVQYGRGVLLVRDDNGTWQPPSLIKLTGGSVGTQAGFQATDWCCWCSRPDRAFTRGCGTNSSSLRRLEPTSCRQASRSGNDRRQG